MLTRLHPSSKGVSQEGQALAAKEVNKQGYSKWKQSHQSWKETPKSLKVALVEKFLDPKRKNNWYWHLINTSVKTHHYVQVKKVIMRSFHCKFYLNI